MAKKSGFDTKIGQVRKYLLDGNSITSWEAIQKFSATRLSAIIFVLKNDYGMNIATEMVEDPVNGTRYAKYWLNTNPKTL